MVITSILKYFSPEKALQRMHYKEAVRHYEAASRKGKFGLWRADRNQASTRERDTIADRSTDLTKNNPFIKKGFKTITNNVISTGITLEINTEKEKNEAIYKQLWSNWALSTKIDTTGRRSLNGLQRKIVYNLSKNGEVFIRKIVNLNAPKDEIPWQLQLLDPRMIASTSEYEDGIVKDDYGKPMRYIFKKDLTKLAYGDNLVEVDASEIIHVFDDEDCGQSRGLSIGHTIITISKNLDDYMYAQLVKQKISACFAGFFRSDDNAPGIPKSPEGFSEQRIEPGVIKKLDYGESMTFSDPPKVDGFNGVIEWMLRSVAAGMGVSYESLTGDYSKVNYSSGKLGADEAHKNYNAIQDLMIDIFCSAVFEMFKSGCELIGKNPDRDKLAGTWIKPRRAFLDPNKETTAMIKQVRSGFMSWSEAVRELGRDPESLLMLVEKYNKLIDEKGIKFDSDPRRITLNGILQLADEEEDEDED
jgi:lambda family phage portal protein